MTSLSLFLVWAADSESDSPGRNSDRHGLRVKRPLEPESESLPAIPSQAPGRAFNLKFRREKIIAGVVAARRRRRPGLESLAPRLLVRLAAAQPQATIQFMFPGPGGPGVTVA